MSAHRQLYVLAVTAGATLVAAILAWVLGVEVWAAALGAALVLVYWGVGGLFAGLAGRAATSVAVGIGVAGMVARLTLVVGCLIAVGLLARPSFATCAVSFLAVFNVSLALNLVLAAVRGRRTPRSSGR